MPIELPVSLVWVQNFQFQYAMIDNAAQLSYLNLLRNSRGISLSRTSLYNLLADTWNRFDFMHNIMPRADDIQLTTVPIFRFGKNGTACVLRIICEVSHSKRSNFGLFGTILKTVFT